MTLVEQITLNTSPGEHYKDAASATSVDADSLVKLIAFYLPQFHPIPQNDTWWGKGFTEWTNVTKAIPRFVGHYQPRLPGELGFYNLAHADALHRQAELARTFGVAGFCFHHYWFSGERILNQPIDLLLSRPDIQMPFCINWANESWTRRWDGHEKDVLLAQKHSPDDDVAFAKSLEPFFRDPRYIRVKGLPLLMLYRPSMLPDAAATVARWRAHFRQVGIGDVYVVMAQAFGDGDAAKYGMDAAVGFPPFWASGGLPKVEGLNLFDPKYRGEVVDYEAMAAATIAGYANDRRVFPGVCPSWDNEARKPGRGSCFTGSTPDKYGRWLTAACHAAIRSFPPDERFVFINAWNEWAEGAYLEPDRHFGRAYLAETARVLNGLTLAVGDPAPEQMREGPTVSPPPKPALSMRRRALRLRRRISNRLATVADDIAWKLRSRQEP